jgi:predicted nucleic acid-binding protein
MNSNHLLGCEIEGIAGILDRRGEIEIAKKLCEIATNIIEHAFTTPEKMATEYLRLREPVQQRLF